MSRTIVFALPLACVLAGPALAADPSPARAATAEDAIRDFVRNLLGPSVTIGDKPVRLQPNGDHYDASVTLAPGQPTTNTITATVREGAAGVWTFDTLRYPNPLHFTVDLPKPGGKGPDTRLTYDIKSAQRDGAGTIDTSLATASTATASTRALDVALTGTDQSSSSHVGNATSVTTLRPGKAANSVDLLSTSSLTEYAITASTQTPDMAVNMRIDADSLQGKLEMAGIDRTKGVGMIRAIATLIASGAATGGTAGKEFDVRPVHAMLEQLDGLANSLVMDNTAVKLRGVVNGFAFGTERARLALDTGVPDGLLAMGMEIEMNGLTLPATAGTPMAPFIPSKVQFHPYVSGLNSRDVIKALLVTTDPARQKDAGPPPEVLGLMTSPKLAGGIESMEIDLGESVLKGSGKVTMPAPGRVAGVGQIAITGFDALTEKVKALPQANEVLPVFLFAKGIGRTDGARLVWDITYDGAKLLVNNVDVLAMAGGKK